MVIQEESVDFQLPKLHYVQLASYFMSLIAYHIRLDM
jgi:hypothetical protein